ncbi:MAG: hypothetical protein U9R42_01070, partial [Bacteroidota bacterium]|nr:hypothetical protein [Bacteroidota bacterium]
MKLIVKIVLIIIVTCTQVVAVYAASYTSAGDGDWTATATWGSTSTPVKGDDVTINHDVILDVDIPQNGLSSLNISSSGSLIGSYLITMATNANFSVSGSMDIDELDIKNTSGSVEINAGATVNVTSIITGGSQTTMTVDGKLTAGNIYKVSISGTGEVTSTAYTGSTSVFGNATPINGTTYYGIRWTGTTNAIWETASNWYNSVIPDALQTCQIIG